MCNQTESCLEKKHANLYENPKLPFPPSYLFISVLYFDT